MPRRSPYEIVLADEERRELLRISRKYTSPYCEVVRARIVLLAADGLTNDDIGRRLDVPRPIVSKWRKRFFEQRLDGLKNLPRPGRPRSFSPSAGRAGEGRGL